MYKPRMVAAFLFLAILFVGSGLLGSCFWNPNQADNEFTIGLSSLIRASVNPSPVQVNFARVFLYTHHMNTQVLLLDSATFKEASVASETGTVTLIGVPARTSFELVITLGTKPDCRTFIPFEYGKSAEFDVINGHKTQVRVDSVTTVKSALQLSTELLYDTNLLGKELVGLATDAANLATATQNTAYFGPDPGSLSTNDTPGATIRSVSFGNLVTGEFWVDTSASIAEYVYRPTPVLTRVYNLPVGRPARPVVRTPAFEDFYSATNR